MGWEKQGKEGGREGNTDDESVLEETFPLKKRSISRAHRVIETSKTNDKTME